MTRPCIVPVDLGGSPTACRLRPPRQPAPTPALVQALAQHYRAERAAPGVPLEVAFFRGGVPDDALLHAAAPHAVRVACSPADLTRAEAARLLAHPALRTLELEVATLHTPALRECQRGYTGAMVVETMLPALRRQAPGLRLGATLLPGLPGTSHDLALADAVALSRGPARVDFVRICPAIAWEGAPLAHDAQVGRWRPMHLGEAVTTTLALVDIFEAAGVEVVRLGLHPGQDVPHPVAAGPYHPNLRQLVEVRRFYARMEALLSHLPAGSQVAVSVNPRDLAWAKGTANENIRALRARLRLEDVRVQPDDRLARGEVSLARVL